MKTKAFENMKPQIGFCGIWCGSGAIGNGTLKELTQKYEELIEGHDLEEWTPKDFDFQEFRKGLASIQAISFCQGGLKGGVAVFQIRSYISILLSRSHLPRHRIFL